MRPSWAFHPFARREDPPRRWPPRTSSPLTPVTPEDAQPRSPGHTPLTPYRTHSRSPVPGDRPSAFSILVGVRNLSALSNGRTESEDQEYTTLKKTQQQTHTSLPRTTQTSTMPQKANPTASRQDTQQRGWPTAWTLHGRQSLTSCTRANCPFGNNTCSHLTPS